MTWDRTHHGWVRLDNGFDVRLEHGVPVRLSDNGLALDGTLEALEKTIADASGLPVTVCAWEPGETDGEKEAPLRVDPNRLEEVLRRFAMGSAALFFDRFRKPLDRHDVDWDAAEYAVDFHRALEVCGLDWGDADKDAHFDAYARTMHDETERLAAEA